MTIGERILKAVGLQRFQPYTPEEIAAMWGSGLSYMPSWTYDNKTEPIGPGFQSLVTMAYAQNPVVFAVEQARVQLFSEARFTFQKMPRGVPGEYDSTPETYLRLLTHPWPGGTTSNLLRDMLLDADLAGNAFILREQNGLRRLRPDWVTIIAGNPRSDGTTWDLDTEVLGYGYQPDGPTGGKKMIFLDRQLVAHFKSTHDPLRRFAGMPWLLPVIKDISADGSATSHKLKYFEHAATPNMAVRFPETMTRAQAQDWRDLFAKDHEGTMNAYRTLFLGGGADMTIVGASLRQADFSGVQSAGELRISSAGGVPPIIIGIKGGLDSATYSNYGQARRAFADLTMRPLWRDACGSLETITTVPSNSRLWYDDKGISFLQEDIKDAADIQSAQAAAMRQLIDAGWEPDSVTAAIVANDFTRLKHSGLYSVQLQPPGTTAAPSAPALPDAATPALLNSGTEAGEVRCSCGRLLAEIAAPPYRFTCSRCKATTDSANLIAA